MHDEFYMRRALRLAAKARGMTSPNPMVGAVIVKDGKVLAENFHKKSGSPHAEAHALEKAGNNARGATLYVNLEPCCHTEKKTPPCTNAIINSGISRLVIGMIDPNPKVSGRGIEELHKAGIQITLGVLEGQAKKLNEAYIKYITTGKPLVILKVAMTLDGKIATPEGQSKWVTSERSRKIVHRLRSSVDVVLTGIGTVKTDDPQLTARIRRGKNPLRIVVDPNFEIPLDARVLQVPPPTTVITKKSEFYEKKNMVLDKGVRIVEYEGEKLDLQWLMQQFGEKQITSVLIEAGSSLNAHALEKGIVDKVIFFIAPKMIGGWGSFPAVGGKTFRKLEEAYRLEDITIRRVAEDILIEGYIIK